MADTRYPHLGCCGSWATIMLCLFITPVIVAGVVILFVIRSGTFSDLSTLAKFGQLFVLWLAANPSAGVLVYRGYGPSGPRGRAPIVLTSFVFIAANVPVLVIGVLLW
jgi:hypothetical protein